MTVVASDAPMLVLFIVGWYLPPVLWIYYRRARHICLKYRLPRRTIVPMLLFTVYAIVMPATSVFGKDWPSIGSYVLTFIVIPMALVFFIITETMIVVLFQITELLMLPQSSTPRKVRRLILYRWLLHPPIQIFLAALVLVGLVTPFLRVDAKTLFLPDAVGTVSPQYQELTLILIVEVVCLLLLVLILSWYISHVVDNFGLRRSYQQTFRGIILILVLIVLARVAADGVQDDTLRSWRLPSFFSVVGAHTMLYFHVFLPVRAMRASRDATLRRVQRSPSRIHPHSMLEKKAILEKFLMDEHRFRNFLTFARMEYTTEPLLALQAITAFEAGEPSLSAASRLVAQCLSPRCELETEVGKRLSLAYHDKLGDLRNADAPRTPPQFFHAFRQELLVWILHELVPAFTEHPLGVEYVAFMRLEKSMDRLNVVLACVEDLDTS
ncbi:hypothetical protein SPRG_17998 [Saprolegnia parasitica CBS 223.65]|uniref:RGS domain-containing protein n=1 Tax=Saprolegnia parasitica (strain CBS 223.65) TaxID=695850 RepID=A0A067BDN5_SAPPC|nr:hypothetical protein SPRG_17998 [Saprolegnia parasitica CBS 223.65]KDO16479.1 hypothetical protein SPRG_17998 [Saprolegnia parasitica CBS 223.65]|eukprot:XP_012212814.1 hypothetical protein SPRG_17998 [Saprolegnia parasitica CBS 223.65]